MLPKQIKVILGVLFILVESLNAQQDIPVQILSDSTSSLKVNKDVLVFQTKDTLNPQQAWQQIQSNSITQVPYRGNPGMTNSDFGYWILFSVRNETQAEKMMLELSYPQLDLTSLSLVEGDSALMIYQTGDSFLFSQRPYPSHNFVFPISIPKGQARTYLLNADKRNSAVRFPLRLYTQKDFEAKTEKERLYLTVYYVFLIVVVFISATIGVALKKWVFIWYAVSVFFYALWLFTWQGFSYKYLTSSFPELNRHFLAFCSQMAVVSLLVLIQSYFETKTLLPKFHKAMNGVLIFFGVGTLVWIIIPDVYVAYAPKLFALRYLLVGSILVFGFTSAIKYARIDGRKSLIFALSYTLFFFSIVAKILDEYGVISEYNFLLDPILVGNLVQVIGLSVAMILILAKIVKEREELQRKASLRLTEKESEEVIEEVPKEEELNGSQFISLKSGALIDLQNLLYVSSDGGYCEFYLKGKDYPEIDRRSLVSLESELPSYFLRIHRSTIVNLKQVRQAKSTKMSLHNGVELTISRSYKDQVKEVLAKK